MGLETGTYIDDLVVTNPVGASDNRSEGDDHLRLIKDVLKNTLPGMVGAFGRIQAKGSAYTAVLNDNQTVINATSTWTLDLTAAATLGDGWTIVLFNNGAGVITIDPDGAETINAAATLDIAAGRVAVIVCDGSNLIAMVSLIADSYVLEANDLNFTGQNDFAGITTFDKGIGPRYLLNLRIAASIASNILTIALKGNDGNDASATNPIEIAFRNVSLLDGSYVVRSITAALSMTVLSGGTLGFVASEDGYVHVYAIDNAGTVVLAIAKNPIFDPAEVYSSTLSAVSSDDADTLYSTAAQTSKAIQYLGRVRITHGAVLGEWSENPTEITPALPTFKKRGMEAFTSSGSFTVPEGVYQIYAELVGGGGAGGAVSGDTSGSGGGGGGYSAGYLDVSPGETISVTVGGAGSNSTFGGLTANGGSAGTAGGSGGAGGGSSSGDINTKGNGGGQGTPNTLGRLAIGGHGGGSFFGGGAPGSVGGGIAGGAYGGGGSGAVSGSGGAGAAGVVKVSW